MFTEILTYEEVTSTMKVAASLIGKKQLPYCVQAHKQTEGYGRQGRSWLSEGENLYLTLALAPNVPVNQWYELSFVVAVAVFKTIQFFLSSSVSLKLKWPNDVLIEEKKVSGILIETHSHYPHIILIGIGLNVYQAPFERATCLQEWCKKIQINEVLKKLLLTFEIVYTLWQEEGFSSLMAIWREHGPVAGSSMTFHNQGVFYKGLFEQVDDQGVLHLKTSTGTLLFRSGDVLLP